MITSILGLMAVAIAIKAHNTAVEANERAERSESLITEMKNTPQTICYHAPRPDSKAPKLPYFLRQ